MKSYSCLPQGLYLGAPKSHPGAQAMDWPFCSGRSSKFLLWTWIFTHSPNKGNELLCTSFNNYPFMADLILSLPLPPSYSSNPTMNSWELSKEVMEFYPAAVTTTHLPSRRLDFLVTSQYEHCQSKKERTYFPRHSVYMFRVFHQSYEREWHFHFKLKWLIKPKGWVIEDTWHLPV